MKKVAQVIILLTAFSTSVAVARTVLVRGTIQVPLKLIELSDDDGRFQGVFSKKGIEQYVQFTNEVFKKASLEFVLDLNKEPPVRMRSTVLNRMMGIEDANWIQTKQLGNQIAAKYPGRIVIFFRYGKGSGPNGSGFSWWDYDFVVMPSTDIIEHCGGMNPYFLAHEMGHYLGLPHTFGGGPFETNRAAEKYFASNNSDPKVFDGDSLSDTPPHPSIRAHECKEKMKSSRLLGVLFKLPRTNLMSYYFERKSITAMQASRARWTLLERLRNRMAMPNHYSLSNAIQGERLQVKCPCWWRVQQTNGSYGIGSYSKDEWLLIGLNKGSSAELSFSVKRAGTYEAYVYPLRAPDYGRVELSVNGIRSNKTIDGFAELVMPGGQHSLGQFRLNEGSNVLEVKNIGRNTDSKGFLWAIDAIELSQ